jgi:TetR/AcrR family transcriptional regulator, transcriptional repressor for nem operon
MYCPIQICRWDFRVRTEPTTAKGRATVARVLDAACELFARQGIRATTLDQIGALSRTGRGQLYLYFAGKPDLVAAVVVQQVDRVLDAQQPLLGTISTAAELRAWCDIAAQQYSVHEAIRCPLGSLVHELGEQDVAARAALAEGFGRWRMELAAGLRRVEQRGELAAGADPDSVAAALLAAYEGGVLLAGAAHDPAQLRIVLTAVAGLALGPAPA